MESNGKRTKALKIYGRSQLLNHWNRMEINCLERYKGCDRVCMSDGVLGSYRRDVPSPILCRVSNCKREPETWPKRGWWRTCQTTNRLGNRRDWNDFSFSSLNPCLRIIYRDLYSFSKLLTHSTTDEWMDCDIKDWSLSSSLLAFLSRFFIPIQL